MKLQNAHFGCTMATSGRLSVLLKIFPNVIRIT